MRPTPLTTKEEIFRKYLEGDSIPEIAKLYGVSVGMVSSITKEESRKDNNYFAIREVAKIFRKNNLKISDVISGIRLYNKVKGVGLDIPFFESFIEATDTKSFRIKKDIDKFLEDIKRIIRVEEVHQIKLDKISGHIYNSIRQLNNLKEENKKITEKTKDLYLQYNIDKHQVEEYVKEKPLFLQYKRDKWRYEKRYDWFIHSHTYEEASRKIGITIDPHILYKKLHWLFLFPHKHKDLIKKIMAIDNDIFKSKLE
jgi:hypothetical protein